MWVGCPPGLAAARGFGALRLLWESGVQCAGGVFSGVNNRCCSVVWSELVARRSWNFSCGDGVHYSALGAPGEACGAAWRARSAGSGMWEKGKGGCGARGM